MTGPSTVAGPAGPAWARGGAARSDSDSLAVAPETDSVQAMVARGLASKKRPTRTLSWSL